MNFSDALTVLLIINCHLGQFRCNNGRCINMDKKCNNIYDCTDGSDEAECNLCSTDQFICNDGNCIDSRKRCDGAYDCRDRSDEIDCRNNLCTPYEFRCGDGICIDYHLKCNSRPDCRDGSDEESCECRNDQFRCDNGQCIDDTLRCDQKYDCRDGTDEFNCPTSTCKPNRFRCRSGQCIPESMRCNHKHECADHSDEHDCAIECHLGQFRCSDGQCIDARLRCNLRYDCNDLTDEKDCEFPVKYCHETEFQCGNRECIDISKKCDHKKDCLDGSDESNCQIELCSIHEFECLVDGKCISESLRCDGYYDCHDFSDEQNCESRICRLSQFRCGTGLCIDRALLCNGNTDCPDRSDEIHCWICQSGQYICANGQCIDGRLRCDGTPNCNDFSDEIDCVDNKEVNIQVYPERQSIRQGQEVVFRCRDESERRLRVKWSRSDNKSLPYGSTDIRGRLTIPNIQPEQSGVYVCVAEGDLLGQRRAQKAAFLTVQPYYPIQPITPPPKPTIPPRPPGVCAKSEATCQNGECISREYVCDGDFDCTDRSDEMNCINHCEPNQYQCENGKCILKIWRCDSDNDCEDNSDEKFCEPNNPGSPCRNDEYKCISGDQCIPRSYQCDGEFDCQDKTDEIGCSPPTIVFPPPETIAVTEGETITITCRAVGVPTPLISWRLNWNHIPLPPRVSVTSVDGLGTVTIREAKVSDQGAWSCEAINVKDSVLASHDALLVVKPKHAICQSPTFNDNAHNPSECIRCFCFGVSETCHSSSLRVIGLPLQTKLNVIPLIRESNGSYTDMSRRFPPNQNAIKFNPTTREHSIGSDVAAISTPDDVYFYWTLPAEFLGNKLQSYGGYIRYTMRYREPFSPKSPKIPDIIIKGNDINLYHYVKSGYNPNSDNPIKIRLWEGDWHKNDVNARSEIPPLFDATTREDIMIALQNIDHIYIKATYDEQLIDSSLLNLELDTAVLTNHSTAEHAVYVEKCSCPEGYLGSSCEECAPGYVRQSAGRYLGRCVVPSVPCNCNSHSTECDQRTNYCYNCLHNTEGSNCERCKRGYYGDPTSGREDSCRPCPCPHIQPSSQFSPTCYLDPSGGDVVCDACPIGFEGRRCERCAPGYVGNPAGGTPCEPRGDCTSAQFRCGNGTCIDIRLRCNQVYDCVPEGNDESGCACNANNFRCFDGGCIDIALRCDGINNCFDNSDETNCNGLEAHCDPVGSLTSSPSPSTRLCQCKPSVTGARCDQCRANAFHLSEDSPNGCIDCFCFGVTKSCTSSNYFRDHIQLQFTNDPNGVKLSNLDKTVVIDRDLRIDHRNREIVYRDFALKPKLTYYWSLPEDFLGNKIASYGGQLNYTIRYDRGFLSRPNDDPDVQISGNGVTIIYKHNKPFQGGVANTVSIPIYENVWLLSNGQRASREKLMMTLADIDSLLLKATYSSDAMSVSLLEVTLDIGKDRFGGVGGYIRDASAVELCRCPIGYQGLSCEQCIPGYTRAAVGPYLGLCEPCFCNGHSSDCDPKTGICKNCQHNTNGDFCEECTAGYVGDASRGTPYDCSPDRVTPCQCDPRGSESRECDYNQNCLCKTHVKGINCDQCSDGYFNLEDKNVLGCSQCFCSGVTRRCSSSSYFREQITMRLEDLPNPYGHNFQITNRYKSRVFSEGIIINPTNNEVSFTSFSRESPNTETLFWALPEIFLGNKLTSYGGMFSYTQQYTISGNGEQYSDADIEITGNGIKLVYVNSKVLTPGEPETYEIELREGSWQRIDTNRNTGSVLATREDFLLVLSNIEVFSIRASFHSNMQQTILRNIILDTAIPQNTGRRLATEVEQCVCPPGYIGLSCEECAPGYIRDSSSPGYGRCTRCNCNSHSETCDPNTGFCVYCRHNTVGESCERCADGFYGDATRGTPEDCKPCPCPLAIPSNSFSPTCRQDSDGQPTCNACATGYSGRNCEQCSFGYRGNPLQPGSRCEQQSSGGPTIRVRIDEPKVQRVPVGSAVTFRCNGVSQVSDITYNLVWTKESGSLPSRASEASGILTIPDVRPEYSGVYICTGSDLQSVAQDHATLIVVTSDQPAVPRVRIEPYYQEVNVGDDIEFRCTAEGYPPPELRWTGGRNNILNPSSTFLNGVFRIQSVRKSDESEYFCHASNSAGTDSLRTILFVKGEDFPDIGGKPHVTISPVNYESRRGETVRFDCKVTGSPLPELKWTYSGGELPEESRVVGGLLILSRVSEAHQGLYTCTARNTHGTTQSQARLSIESGRAIPTAKIEPERQTIVQGQSGELRCITSGNPIPTIAWQKVGGDLAPLRHKNNGDTLVIEDALIEDRGLYVCRADNREGSAQSSAIVEIERREIPAIELYPESSQVAVRGGSALFQCRITAGVPVPTIEWRRSDGSLFTPSTELVDGVIRFNRVTGDEDGTYICTAENIAGRVSAQAVLRIQGAPSVKILQSNPYRVRPNEKIRLECIAEGDPKPNVIWRKHSQPYTGIAQNIPITEVDGKAILEIPAVTVSDSGIYVCTCTSPLGTTEERIQLIVEDSSSGLVVPNIEVEDKVVTVAAGSRAEMRCFVSGTDRPVELRWIRAGNQSLPTSSRVENGILYIDDVKPQDSGDYQCLGVVDGKTVLFEARSRLAVVAPPRIQLHPPRQTAKPGDTVYIDCVASGDQPIAIDWSKIGGSLPPSVNSIAGRLEFRGIQLSDAGRFLCTAVNAAGKAEGVAEVIVDEDSEYKDILRKEETAFVGSNIELKCQFGGSPSPVIRWSKDSVDLPDNSREVNNELWIRNIRLDNAGRYVCTATSNLGILSRDYVVLNVREKYLCEQNQFRCRDGTCIDIRNHCNQKYDCPDYSDEYDCTAIPTLEVKVIPSKDIIYLGDQLTLQCQVTGDPSARVEWTRLSQSGPFPDNVMTRGTMLIVNGVKPENGGVYRCTVDTYAGTYNGDYVLAIQVVPTYAPDAVETRTAPFSSTVVMDCQTTLEQPVAYTWSKQGDTLPSDATTSPDGVITIPNIRGQDAGTYVCTAKNKYASIDIPTVLVVTGVVPYFAQAPLSYMIMPTLPDAYLTFEVELSFKPENPNGLILYNGQIQHSGDFISLGLTDGHVEFRYELGSGVVLLRSEKPIEMKKWHSVRISRNKKDGVLQINDDMEITGSATGRFLGLDLLEPLYIGGVPDFSQISKLNGYDRGFVGCISLFKVGTVVHELIKDAEAHAVTSCETCATSPCLHGGVCQEAALSPFGYKCICPAGFSGQDCEKIGDACYQGVCGEGRCVNKPGGGFDCYCPFGKSGLRCEKEVIIIEPALSDEAYIAYPTPKDTLRKMNLEMKVKPRKLADGLLMYSAQSLDGQGDFTSISIRNKSIEFRFDTGSGPAILRSPEKLQADKWVNILAERNLRSGSLIVGNSPAVIGESPGHTRGLNLRLPLYIGGYDKQQVTIAPLAEITHGFDGCIGHIEVNNVEMDLVNSVIDSANVADCGSDSPCQRSPCLNRGECREIDITEFECVCPQDYSGKLCERKNGVCERMKPCKNGAFCDNIDHTFKCFCAIGFKGDICSEREEFTEPESVRMAGDAFITFNSDYLPHSSSLADEVIRFSLSTQEDEGLIFFHGQSQDISGQGKDFMAAALIDGKIEFSFELGSGSARIRSSIKVNDGIKHNVVIKRKGKEGSLEIDGIYKSYGESSGILQMLNASGDIYFGGLPNFQLMTGDRFKQGFVGCISDLEIGNSGVINIVTAAKSARNVRACDDDLISSGAIS